MINIVAILASLYMLFEAVDWIAKMQGGFRHCSHKLKYIGAASLAVWSIYDILWYVAQFNARDMGGLLVVCAFIFPRTKYRIIHKLGEIA